eukprot:6575499-Pyramimonas_sp.AAC.1
MTLQRKSAHETARTEMVLRIPQMITSKCRNVPDEEARKRRNEGPTQASRNCISNKPCSYQPPSKHQHRAPIEVLVA